MNDLKKLKEQCRELYKERCIVCGRHSRIVHEIIARSSGKVAINIDNMVILCDLCHDYAHSMGSNVAEEMLQLYRQDAIKRMRQVSWDTIDAE
jgi:5-methylcytosine-specific restriction endonuclease McrA